MQLLQLLGEGKKTKSSSLFTYYENILLILLGLLPGSDQLVLSLFATTIVPRVLRVLHVTSGMVEQATEHVTMKGSLTVVALYFFFYAQERLNCHS